jgi:hypothetical protein
MLLKRLDIKTNGAKFENLKLHALPPDLTINIQRRANKKSGGKRVLFPFNFVASLSTSNLFSSVSASESIAIVVLSKASRDVNFLSSCPGINLKTLAYSSLSSRRNLIAHRFAISVIVYRQVENLQTVNSLT